MKKLRICEFRELVFSVSMELQCAPTHEILDVFFSAFLEQLIESRGLYYGGGVDLGFVYRAHGSATDEDRAAVSEWLSARAEIKTVIVSPLQDGWHDGAQYVH
ncbi:50S ribosome-binding protein YggL [Undibacterium sp. Di24W]|uniref:50S ribosome-binding protein YggL n=1 Tax=Undibacterium sp. Di24W TaxID=3413033 RepID=UPI003BF2CE55